MHHDVGEGAHHHAEVAVEGFDPADRFRRRDEAIQRSFFIVAFFDDGDQRPRQEIYQVSCHADRTRAWAAAAMRGGKGLVQVEMHHINAEIAGPDDPQQRVQVGAIAIDQTAGGMNDLDHLQHVLVKQAERVGVGQHQAGQGVVAFGRQRFQIDIAAWVGCQLDHPHAAHGGSGRIGAVGRIGDEDFVAFVSPRDW